MNRSVLFCALLLICVLTGCKKETYVPKVQTGCASFRYEDGGELSGYLLDDGNSPVTAYGIVYSEFPDMSNSCKIENSGCLSRFHEMFSNEIRGLKPGTTYYYYAYIINDIGIGYGDTVSFETLSWVNAHEFVDLGLPSGLLWSTRNTGWSYYYGNGFYYSWAETASKEIYSWVTYKYCNGSFNDLTKYSYDESYSHYLDFKYVLDPSDDASHKLLGSTWRMPTRADFEELIENCTMTWTYEPFVDQYMLNDTVWGYRFEASNGKSLFLPAEGCRQGDNLVNGYTRGYYWLPDLSTEYPYNAKCFTFDSSGYSFTEEFRCIGMLVRAVCMYEPSAE